MTKYCPDCKQTKDALEFGTNSCSIDGLNCYCKLCHAIRSKNWRTKFPEKYKASRRNYQSTHPDKIKALGKAASRRLNGRFSGNRSKAIIRGLIWELSKEQFAELIVKPCQYCGGTLPETGSGLDRKDNNIGYLLDNVVPCCTRCNSMKSKYLTYDEMILIWNQRRRNGFNSMVNR